MRLFLAGVLLTGLLMVTGTARAQAVKVNSGEHADFTRLVLTLPRPGDWQLGRTPDGYELSLGSGSARFDLTGVFRLIPRTRLATIWADPQNGRLRLGLVCTCHATPFEYRPGIIVIDLRDGPPQPGSSFETGLDGGMFPPLLAPPERVLRPQSRRAFGFETLAPPPNGPRLPPATAPPALPVLPLVLLQPEALALPMPERAVALDGLRSLLLEQLGRAATEGVIDVDDPAFPPKLDAALLDGPRQGAARHLAIDGTPSLTARPANTPREGMTADGETCLPDSAVDLLSWSDGESFDAQMAKARAGLVGEFDRPDPERVAALVRLTLYFGFGAEARNLIGAFPPDPDDAALWSAMAAIMDDGMAPPGNPLVPQAACPGAVALWSALARPVLSVSDGTNLAALTAAFSALPVHLRRHLGPGLADKFIAAGDLVTAQRLRDAIWRAPGDPGPGARMVDAELDRRRGNLKEAEANFEAAARSGGPVAVRALIGAVDARVALGEAIDAGTLTELAALRREHKGDALEPALLRAEMLAGASADNYEAAFNLARGATPKAVADLWQLLAARGPDSALLTHAVVARAEDLPKVDDVTREKIGTRLLGLGFPDDALLWLPPGNIVAVAGAELQRGDARAALRVLAGETGPEAARIRAGALTALGDAAAAAGAFAAAGDEPARVAALWRAQDWRAGTLPDQAVRSAALETLTPVPISAPAGPLAQGRALVAESAAARDAIKALLQDVPDPSSSPP